MDQLYFFNPQTLPGFQSEVPWRWQQGWRKPMCTACGESLHPHCVYGKDEHELWRVHSCETTERSI